MGAVIRMGSGARRFPCTRGSLPSATHTTRLSTTVHTAPAAQWRRRSGSWPAARAGNGTATRVIVRGGAAYHTRLEGCVMKDVVSFLQNLDALAFVLLGVATAVGWTRRRDRSLLWLPLALVLLSVFSLLGRLAAPLHLTLPLLPPG